jgi:hypothetical protein
MIKNQFAKKNATLPSAFSGSLLPHNMALHLLGVWERS